MRFYRSAILGAGASMIAVFAATSALGQAAPVAPPSPLPAAAPDAGIQDIVVTAQRRTESVQKASVSISVISPDQLAKAGVTQAQDLSRVVPGVQIGQGGAATQIYIRGVGDFGSTSLTNPAVSFNVDGVYIARPAGIEGNFFDVERVEVLKGPQGTLYGRNATGGAINVITNKPKLGVRELIGAIEGGNYKKLQGEAAVNIPIGDSFAVRAAAQVVTRDGYLTEGWDDEVRQSGRIQGLWEATPRIKLLIKGDFTHVGGVGANYAPLPTPKGLSPWTSTTDPAFAPFQNAAAVANGLCAPTGAPFPTSPGNLFTYPGGGCPNLVIPAGPFAGTYPQQQLVANHAGEQGFTDNKIWGVSGQLDADLGFATLTLLPSFRRTSLDYTTYPGASTRFDISAGGVPEVSKVTTVEARLGHDSALLKWVLGGFYYNEDQFGLARVTSGFVQDTIISQALKTRSYAAFGQATVSVSDSFRLIAGGRYTSDERKASFLQYVLAGSGAFYQQLAQTGGTCAQPAFPDQLGSSFIGCPLVVNSGDKTFKKFNYKVGAEYDLTQRNMVYATYSTGFKGGGFYFGTAPGGSGAGSYRPEQIKALEIGSRNRFFNNHLQLNFEGFYYKYKDHQEPVIILDGVGNIAQSIQNAGSGRVYGASGDLVFKPTRNDTLHVGVEYLDTKYNSFSLVSPLIAGVAPFFPPGSTGCPVTTTLIPNPTTPVIGQQSANCAGFPFTRAPKWSGTVGVSHIFDLPNGDTVEPEGNMQFQSSRYLATDYLVISDVGSYQIYNASLTYTLAGNHLSLTGYIRNIGNEAVFTGANRSSFVVGISSSSIAPPRTYGARLNFRF